MEKHAGFCAPKDIILNGDPSRHWDNMTFEDNTSLNSNWSECLFPDQSADLYFDALHFQIN